METLISATEHLPTPALVIDAAVAQRNIQRLADYAKRHGLGLRPHTKTHKSRRLAQMQLAAGAIGLTTAKAGEAEEMASVSEDLLIAYPAVDPARSERISKIARTKTVHVAVDSVIAVEALSSAAKSAGSTIGLLVDIDVGMERTGVSSPQEALALAKLISQSNGVRLDGLFCYPGHIWVPVENQPSALATVAAKLDETLSLWSQYGLEAKIVSGGSTPTAYQSHFIRAFTEIRPGTYVFNDMNTVRGSYCAIADCAAGIVCTVVSDAVRNQVVLDGGTKTFTSDQCIPAPTSGHGYIVEYPEAKITRLSEEHGQVDVSGCERRPKVGERVTVIPNHICPCVNLQDSVWWLEEGNSLTPLPVDARGKLS